MSPSLACARAHASSPLGRIEWPIRREDVSSTNRAQTSTNHACPETHNFRTRSQIDSALLVVVKMVDSLLPLLHCSQLAVPRHTLRYSSTTRQPTHSPWSLRYPSHFVTRHMGVPGSDTPSTRFKLTPTRF